jgi:hypothetical protein
MSLKEDVEDTLYLGAAPDGYTVREISRSAVTAEDPAERSGIAQCNEILALAGYRYELRASGARHVLIVRGRHPCAWRRPPAPTATLAAAETR